MDWSLWAIRKKLRHLLKIRIKKSLLRSDLCNYSDGYIVVKGDIIANDPDDAKRDKNVAFKNNAPFINCISKINRVQTDNTEEFEEFDWKQ